jgi:hypothetical protein
MFIGDSAPLSFLQSVRHFIITHVSSDGFAAQSGCDALLEQSDTFASYDEDIFERLSSSSLIDSATTMFCSVTSAMVDVGSHDELKQQIDDWIMRGRSNDISSAVNYLIVAIGVQTSDDELATNCYHRARNIALGRLTFDTSPLTVQAFLLIAVYMLRSCQSNGSFMYFGLAARASYSIGMHRAQVNARLGETAQGERERL